MTALCMACDEGDPYAECTCTQKIERIDREAAEHDAMMARWPLDFESAEPTFPTLPALRALELDRPTVGEWLNGLSLTTLVMIQGYEDAAEAWAWRCADTMPDSEQDEHDRLSDLVTALTYARDARLWVRP